MSAIGADEINVLKLTLHDRLVGYLAGFQNGRNVLSFADEFKKDPGRQKCSIITNPGCSHSEKVMAEPWGKNQRLHPTLTK